MRWTFPLVPDIVVVQRQAMPKLTANAVADRSPSFTMILWPHSRACKSAYDNIVDVIAHYCKYFDKLFVTLYGSVTTLSRFARVFYEVELSGVEMRRYPWIPESSSTGLRPVVNGMEKRDREIRTVVNACTRARRNAGRGKSGTIVVYVSETVPYLMRVARGNPWTKETGEIFTKAAKPIERYHCRCWCSTFPVVSSVSLYVELSKRRESSDIVESTLLFEIL